MLLLGENDFLRLVDGFYNCANLLREWKEKKLQISVISVPANVIIEVCIWGWLGSNKRLSFAFRISCSCMYAHTVYIILTKRCLQFSFSHSLTHTLNDTHPISLFKPVPHVHICSVFKPVPPAIWAQLEAPLPVQASGKGPSLLSSSLISVASVLWQPLTLALRNYCCLKQQDGMGNERGGRGGGGRDR